MEHRQDNQDQIIYSRIERVIAYKNVQFIIEHQNDTLEQLSAYLQSCMEDIGHPPAMVEVIGGEYIQYRFGSWQKAIRTFYGGKITTISTSPTSVTPSAASARRHCVTNIMMRQPTNCVAALMIVGRLFVSPC